MLKSKIARPLDQKEKEWANTDTMLTDDNDDEKNQIFGYTDCASDYIAYNIKQYHYCNLKHSSDQLHGLVL